MKYEKNSTLVCPIQHSAKWCFFWSTNSSFWLLLAIQSVTHVTNSTVFSEVLYGKYSTVIRLMFTHVNTLNDVVVSK